MAANESVPSVIRPGWTGGRGVRWQRIRWCIADAIWASIATGIAAPVVAARLLTGRQLVNWTRAEVSAAALITLAGSVVVASSAVWKAREPVGRWLCATLWGVSLYLVSVFSALTAPKWLYPWIIAVTWPAVPLIPVFFSETMTRVVATWQVRKGVDRRWSRRLVAVWNAAAGRRVGVKLGRWSRELAVWRLVAYLWAGLLVALGEVPGLLMSTTMRDEGPWLGWGFHAHRLYLLVSIEAECMFVVATLVAWAGWRLRAPAAAGARFLVRWTPPLATVFAVLSVLLFLAAGEGLWPEAIIDLALLPPLLAYSVFLLAHGSARASRRGLYILRRTWWYWIAATATGVALSYTTEASRFAEGVGAVVVCAVGGAASPRLLGPPRAPVRGARGARRGSEQPRKEMHRPQRGEPAALVAGLAVLAGPSDTVPDEQALIAAATIGRVISELEVAGRDLIALLGEHDHPGGQTHAIPPAGLARLISSLSERFSMSPEHVRDLVAQAVFSSALTIHRSERAWRSSPDQPSEAELVMWTVSEACGPCMPEGTPDRDFEERLRLEGRAWQAGTRHPSGILGWQKLSDPTTCLEELRLWADWHSPNKRTREANRQIRGPRGRTRFSDPGRTCVSHYDEWLPRGFDRVVAHWRTQADRATSELSETGLS